MTGPLLASVVAQDQANRKANFESPTTGNLPLSPPDLYQDSGGGYNANFVFPQE